MFGCVNCDFWLILLSLFDFPGTGGHTNDILLFQAVMEALAKHPTRQG